MDRVINHIEKLKKGYTISFRPKGNSMTGKISSGQLCTVAPIKEEQIEVGDMVLCKVKGRKFLHLVTAIRDKQFQISNNHGYVNGWITYKAIFGKCISVV